MNSIARRVVETPRISKIRTEEKMYRRIEQMSSLELWIAMFTKGLTGWKHKIMSDEFEKRRKRTKDVLGLFVYER